jgi:hypothetical protein
MGVATHSRERHSGKLRGKPKSPHILQKSAATPPRNQSLEPEAGANAPASPRIPARAIPGSGTRRSSLWRITQRTEERHDAVGGSLRVCGYDRHHFGGTRSQ